MTKVYAFNCHLSRHRNGVVEPHRVALSHMPFLTPYRPPMACPSRETLCLPKTSMASYPSLGTFQNWSSMSGSPGTGLPCPRRGMGRCLEAQWVTLLISCSMGQWKIRAFYEHAPQQTFTAQFEVKEYGKSWQTGQAWDKDKAAVPVLTWQPCQCHLCHLHTPPQCCPVSRSW